MCNYNLHYFHGPRAIETKSCTALFSSCVVLVQTFKYNIDVSTVVMKCIHHCLHQVCIVIIIILLMLHGTLGIPLWCMIVTRLAQKVLNYELAIVTFLIRLGY